MCLDTARARLLWARAENVAAAATRRFQHPETQEIQSGEISSASRVGIRRGTSNEIIVADFFNEPGAKSTSSLLIGSCVDEVSDKINLCNNYDIYDIRLGIL